MLNLEDLESDARRRFGATADQEVPVGVDPDRRARFEPWRQRRRAERAGKSIGVAWEENLAQSPHPNFSGKQFPCGRMPLALGRKRKGKRKSPEQVGFESYW
jgi:hypothetical protein